MIKFKPESIKFMRKRFQKCLNRIYTEEDIDRDDRPGLKREHVFDFENGLRIIVSIDQPKDKPLLHFSASAEYGSNLSKQIKHKEISLVDFIKLIVNSFDKINTTNKRCFIFTGLSEKGIPHFWEKYYHEI